MLASTLSDESFAWLAQQGGVIWGTDLQHDGNFSAHGKARVDDGFEWDSSSLSMVNLVNPALGSQWLTPESQGWIQFTYPAYGNGVDGDDCWQSMRQMNSPFSVGSTDVEEATGGDFAVNQGQWV